MDDDFNTPRALALIFDEVRALNKLLDEKTTKGIEARYAALRAMCDGLGLLQEGYLERKKQRWLKKGILAESQIETAIASAMMRGGPRIGPKPIVFATNSIAMAFRSRTRRRGRYGK